MLFLFLLLSVHVNPGLCEERAGAAGLSHLDGPGQRGGRGHGQGQDDRPQEAPGRVLLRLGPLLPDRSVMVLMVDIGSF